MTNKDRLKILHGAIDEIKQSESVSLSLDFDEALKEHETAKRPIRIKFKGRSYKLPSSMPMSFMLFFSKNCIKRVKGKEIIEVPNDKIAEFIERMFGTEFLLAMEKHQVGMETVMESFVQKILTAWGYETKDEKKIAI